MTIIVKSNRSIFLKENVMKFQSVDPAEQLVEMLKYFEHEDLEITICTKASMIRFTMYNMRYNHNPVRDIIHFESGGRNGFEIEKNNIDSISEAFLTEEIKQWKKAGYKIICKDGTKININVFD
jgi:hypothetical protein